MEMTKKAPSGVPGARGFHSDASPLLPQTSALDTPDDPRVDIVTDPLVKSRTCLQRSSSSSVERIKSPMVALGAAFIEIAALESSTGSVNFEFP